MCLLLFPFELCIHSSQSPWFNCPNNARKRKITNHEVPFREIIIINDPGLSSFFTQAFSFPCQSSIHQYSIILYHCPLSQPWSSVQASLLTWHLARLIVEKFNSSFPTPPHAHTHAHAHVRARARAHTYRLRQSTLQRDLVEFLLAILVTVILNHYWSCTIAQTHSSWPCVAVTHCYTPYLKYGQQPISWEF